MIERYAVPPEHDEAFFATWAADAPPDATLYRALRSDVPLRYASLVGGPRDGVLLIVPSDAATWHAAFASHQGFLGAELHRVQDGRVIGVVHWSSPLMYARATRDRGEPAGAALYAPVTFVQDRPGAPA